jgi:hypothetical protein
METPTEYANDMPLLSGGKFTSLAAVTFISTVEELLADEAGRTIQLFSEKAFSHRNSPFRTMETLAAYIEECLGEEAP